VELLTEIDGKCHIENRLFSWQMHALLLNRFGIVEAVFSASSSELQSVLRIENRAIGEKINEKSSFTSCRDCRESDMKGLSGFWIVSGAWRRSFRQAATNSRPSTASAKALPAK